MCFLAAFDAYFSLSKGEKRLAGLGLVFAGLESQTCGKTPSPYFYSFKIKGEEAGFSVAPKQYSVKHPKMKL